MPRTQRFALYVQQLAYTKLFETEEREERPDDVLPREDDQGSHYSAWSATSYLGYVPFRGPTNG
jgi:hypothetical protein